MINSYFTFLYNECKRVSPHTVNIDQINQFINSPEGRKGYSAFCAIHQTTSKNNSIQSVANVLTGLSND